MNDNLHGHVGVSEYTLTIAHSHQDGDKPHVHEGGSGQWGERRDVEVTESRIRIVGPELKEAG